jgi:hypothetical protein
MVNKFALKLDATSSARNALLGLGLAFSIVATSITPANAGVFGPPVRFSCTAGRVAVLKVTVVNDYVRIGYAANSYDAGFDNVTELNPGVRRVNTGFGAGYWQHWAHGGSGAIAAYSYTCVNYSFAPTAY